MVHLLSRATVTVYICKYADFNLSQGCRRMRPLLIVFFIFRTPACFRDISFKYDQTDDTTVNYHPILYVYMHYYMLINKPLCTAARRRVPQAFTLEIRTVNYETRLINETS